MKHLAVIMDGNGRYAVARGEDRQYGHKVGAEAFVRACRDFISMPIDILTVYAFSTENYSRPKSEISSILSVIAYFLKNEIFPLAVKNSINVRFAGDISCLSEELKQIVFNAPQFTKGSKTIVIALNYGGLNEICRAFNKLNGKEFISEQDILNNLDLSDLPDPDAVIRYGGYRRLSNFLPLQTRYSELFFIDKYWPEYEKEDFLSVMEEFEKVRRNFGGISD